MFIKTSLAEDNSNFIKNTCDKADILQKPESVIVTLRTKKNDAEIVILAAPSIDKMETECKGMSFDLESAESIAKTILTACSEYRAGKYAAEHYGQDAVLEKTVRELKKVQADHEAGRINSYEALVKVSETISKSLNAK